VLIFSVIGALDKLFGDKLGVGKEFERAFLIFSPMVLSMLGMLVISPAIGVWLTPFFEWFYSVFGIDPSVIPASLFANDMGGMTLSQAVCKSAEVGNFNAFIVSSMLGCVISFTIPFSIGLVKKEQHKDMFFGMLCGIITVPLGCLVSGFMCGLPFGELLLTLLPLILFSVIVGAFLILFPKVCIKAFGVFGFFVKCIATAGLIFAIFTFLTKITVSEHFDTLENAALICVNACVTLSVALPLMYIVSKLLNKPMNKLGSLIGMNGVSAIALLSSLVTNAGTFGVMEKMNKKGVVINSAFAVSASFVFGSHLAFTMAFEPSYFLPMMVGKLLAGVLAVILALLIYKDKEKS
jgi:ethanolamine transporter